MNKKMQLGTFFVLGIVTLLVLFEVVSGVDFLKKEHTYQASVVGVQHFASSVSTPLSLLEIQIPR